MKLQLWMFLPLSLFGIILGSWVNQQWLVQVSVVVLIFTVVILRLRSISND